MLRILGRRSWASFTSIGDRASPQLFRGSCRIGADHCSKGLSLGLMEPVGVQVRSYVLRSGTASNHVFNGSVREIVQGSDSRLLTSNVRYETGPLQLNQVRRFIQLRTNLEVADNSGAKRVQCIKVMKGSNAAQIGDIIMASVKDAQPRGKVKKGEVVTCVVVRAATHKLRRDGSEIKFDKNAVVLVNKQGEPIGTRIFGPVPQELRRRKLVKILTLADNVV